jgi:hypothetical protein
VLAMCHASQDDGHLVFEDLIFHFWGLLDETELENNLKFLEEKKFINQVNHSELLDSRSYGWHRNNSKVGIITNEKVASEEFEQVIN